MNSFLIIVIGAVLVAPVFAQNLPVQGVLEGECLVETSGGVQRHVFNVGPGQKAALGYQGNDGGNYKIEVVNNNDAGTAETWGALIIGLSRDVGSLKSPPELCPIPHNDETEVLAEDCHRRNQSLVHHPLAKDAFQFILNQGYADYEWVDKGITKTVLSETDLRDGVILQAGNSFTLGGTPVLCVASFRQIFLE